ncbi:hypothetical protein [Nocardia carnea]|uniref:hypothetical protein n=1 Tax=Nocardia carnea TaxID=37328 RepID=UPI00245402D3|nr:hypothetical protein [Nocardia carnea]
MNHIRRYKPLDPQMRAAAVAQAQDLMAQGLSRTAAARSIAPAFGVHANTVTNWLREAADAEPSGSADQLRAQIGKLTKELDSLRSLVRQLVDDRTGEPGQDPQ